MDKFFIREIAAVWAFNKQNEAVWKCTNIGKLKITQDGETIRKKDSQGATIFKMDTAKSASISFEVNYWDFNILSMISGADKRTLDGTDNPYMIEPINVPYAQDIILTVEDIENGYVELDETPRRNEYGVCEMSMFRTGKGDTILQNYKQGLFADETHFAVEGNKLMFPTSLSDEDRFEIVYEFNSAVGVELINSADKVPETWKVRILMLVSPICNTDIVSAVWLTANNATPDMSVSLDLGAEDNIPVSLELGYSICDDKKELYKIVSAYAVSDESYGIPLRTNDRNTVYTYDQDSVRTIS